MDTGRGSYYAIPGAGDFERNVSYNVDIFIAWCVSGTSALRCRPLNLQKCQSVDRHLFNSACHRFNARVP